MESPKVYHSELGPTVDFAPADESQNVSLYDGGEMPAEAAGRKASNRLPLAFKITLTSIALACFGVGFAITMHTLAPDALDLERQEDLARQYSYLHGHQKVEQKSE